MLTLKGSWGDRPESVQSCAERLQRSWDAMPSEPDAYGPWLARDYTLSHSEVPPLVPIDIQATPEVERQVIAETEDVNGGPRSAAGFYIEFSRESLIERYTDGGRNDGANAQYKLRAGFVNRPRPHNHLIFKVNAATDPGLIRAYFTSLVCAWEPNHLTIVSFELMKAQGRRTPQFDLGWLTYFRDGIPLNTALLDPNISVASEDGGRYLTLSGSPQRPDFDQVLGVRHALGYV